MVPLKTRFSNEKYEEENSVEQVVTDFANFVKEKETKEFLEKWKEKGYKKLGVTELLFILWTSGGTKNKKDVLSKANELLEKLKGEGEWFSFLSELKLTPENLLKKS